MRWALPLLLVAACGGEDGRAPVAAMPEHPAAMARGLELFALHCAECHGDEGRGDGPQAPFLDPLPRDLALGSLRYASTVAGFPTAEDLERVLREGIPGSAMPPFARLSSEERDQLVLATRRLALAGRTDALLAADPGLDRALATAAAAELVAPGPLLELPPRPAAASARARGRELFDEMCAACHALDDEAGGRRDLQDETGAFVESRSLATGLFGRGDDERSIALTILRGLPGTPMPAFPLDPEDLWALVDLVRSLRAGGGPFPDRQPADRTVVLTGVARAGIWTSDAVEVGDDPIAPTPARVLLRPGETVRLVLRSADGTHTFYSPELGLGPVEVFPGRPAELRFTAPAAGEYDFYCVLLCSPCHFSMRGVIMVAEGEVDPARFVPDPAPLACAERPPIPGDDAGLVEQGRALYAAMGCVSCHGEDARGGFASFNALPVGSVPALDTLAESLFLRRPRDAELRAVSDLLERGVALDSLREPPPVDDWDRLLRGVTAFNQTLRSGVAPTRREPTLPAPPLVMPAWQARLTDRQADALLAYLLDLYPGSDAARREPVRQPVEFNHRLHVVDVGFECADCHQGAAAGDAAGFPDLALCADCHGADDLEADPRNPELVALAGFVEREEAVPWRRVHALPDHARFSHRRHVDAAGLACQDCHGAVETLERPPARPASVLRMAWCLECHRERGASEDCHACHR
ncbi:MAG TPA: c-type cytochrome [Thermoanaerobaculia bacterium]|nr:c-type cytochrome [Thermoanaerobaculia bacterium]